MVNSSLAEKQDDLVAKIRIIDQPKEEIKWCTVSLLDVINTGKRLEAAVFEIEGKHAREAIVGCKYKSKPFADWIKGAYYPGRFKRLYSDSINGIPFYLPSQMTDIYPRAEKYISSLTKCDINELRLTFGDVLLTRSGTIGNVTIVTKTLEDSVFSDDVIRITPTYNDAGFLYAYFRSSVGKTILQTNQYGSVIQHIEPEHLAGIPIPNPPDKIKQRINDLIMRSFALRDKSNKLIDKAAGFLISELNLLPINEIKTTQFDDNTSTNNYEVKLSNIKGRLDSSYHVPIVETIAKHLKDYSEEVTTVGDSRISSDILLPGRFKRVYVDEGQGVVFFSGKNIMELDPSDKRYLSFSQHESRIREQLTICKDMILVTCSGTVGKVAFVPKHWDSWAMTHDIIRIVPNDRMQGYLFIWLQSEYAKVLLEAKAYGAVVSHIEIPHIASIPVPLLKNQQSQNEINNLALKANALRYEAYQLEQEAMKAMDDEVIFAK